MTQLSNLRQKCHFRLTQFCVEQALQLQSLFYKTFTARFNINWQKFARFRYEIVQAYKDCGKAIGVHGNLFVAESFIAGQSCHKLHPSATLIETLAASMARFKPAPHIESRRGSNHMTRMTTLMQTLRTFILIILVSVAWLGAESHVALAQIDQMDKQPALELPTWEHPFLARSGETAQTHEQAHHKTVHERPSQPSPTQTDFDCTQVSEVPQAECEALVAFYESTGGNNWTINTSWLATTRPCEWYGVTCTSGRVTRIDLHNDNNGNGLTGPIPSNIGDLTSLDVLNLNGDANNITQLPPEIGNLSSLTILALAFNDVSNLPDEIGNLTNLEQLWLPANELQSLPESIGTLTNLTTLSLFSNNLAVLPPSIGSLANLTELHLNANLLTDVPEALGDLSNLSILYLENNELSEIPDQFGQLSDLTVLFLHNNNLSTIPSEFGNLTNLTELRLYSNQLTSIPTGLGALNNLVTLSFSDNQLSELPSDLGDLNGLTTLFISNNRLTSLPNELGQLTALTRLSLYNNRLTSLPTELGNLTSLTELDFENNQLSNIPDSLGQLDKLTLLDLGSNQLTTLPEEIGGWTSMQQLYLNGNQLSSVPAAIGNLLALTELRLYSNQLVDLPDEIGALSALQALYLYENALASLPNELGNLSNLTTLSLRNNQLLTLPVEIGNLTNLSDLRIEVNQLITIPATLGNLSNLRSLTLSDNQLTALPDEIGDLTDLTVLYLHHNQLATIPSSIGNLVNLVEMPLNDNQLTVLPDEIGALVQLEKFYIWNNQLATLPDSIGQISSLREFRADENKLVSLPDTLGNLAALEILSAYTNNLDGLPDKLTDLTNLRSLSLGNNSIEELPSEIGQLTKLNQLLLTSNRLSNLPASIVNIETLAVIELSYNKLAIDDQDILDFLTRVDPNDEWTFTQTVPPTNFTAIVDPDSEDRIVLEWTPIQFLEKGGYYEIRVIAEGEDLRKVKTANKSSNKRPITGLTAGTTYSFTIQSHTPAHTGILTETWDDQRDDLWSESSPVEMATTVFFAGADADEYESDNRCEDAKEIVTNGEPQTHTLHHTPNTEPDQDWVYFSVTEASTYQVEISIPRDSRADIDLAYFDQCDRDVASLGEWNESHTPGALFEITAQAGQTFYIKSSHVDDEIAGDDVSYEISVRKIDAEFLMGPVIILAGKYKENDPLQPNIDDTAKKMYELFLEKNGDSDTDIRFLSTGNEIDRDELATSDKLRESITDWARTRVSADQSLTLYLVDHGIRDQLYIQGSTSGNDDMLTSQDLDSWLTRLENEIPGLQTNIIIEACYSGSFIHNENDGNLRDTISKEGRLVISSTNHELDSYATEEGIQFSDALIEQLGRNIDLSSAFDAARKQVIVGRYRQIPWIDGDGDGVANEPEDIAIAATRRFPRSPSLSVKWPPYIANVEQIRVEDISNNTGTFEVEVRDDQKVERVWAIVYTPDYEQPQIDGVMDVDDLEPIDLKPLGADIWQGEFKEFGPKGVYQFVIYATDEDDLNAQPVTFEIDTTPEQPYQTYLPLVSR